MMFKENIIHQKGVPMRVFLGSLVTAVMLSVPVFGADLVIDESHSEVGFSVKHLMISNVKGKFKEYEGDIDFDLKTKKFNKFNAKVAVKSVDTGIEKRDDHLRSGDFFDEAKHPMITFSMSKYTPKKGDRGEMDGILTMRGVSKPVKLAVEIGGIVKDPKGETKVGFSLSGKVNRKDFGLNWNKVLEAGGLAVGEEVKIVVELETSVL